MKAGRQEIHRWIFLTGILLVIVGIPFSRFLMSSGQLLLSINWLAEGRYREKWARLKGNWPVLLFLGIYFIHAIGMTYSNDLGYAIKDLRIKLPLLALPIIFSTADPISPKQFRNFLMGYIAAVVFASLRSVWEYYQGVNDVRNISVFISHIRFSLNVCMSIFILGFSLSRRWYLSRSAMILQYGLMLWLLVFLFILQSFTGIAIFLAVVIILLAMYSIRQKNIGWRYGMLSAAVLIPLAAFIYVWSIAEPMLQKDEVDFSNLDKYSAEGSFYHHDTNNRQTINGHYIWLYLAEDELRSSWEARSEIPYDGKTVRGNKIRDLLIRHLTSKGLRKDAAGVEALSSQDIDRIEAGLTNVHCAGENVVKRRICQILWEYDNYLWTGDPSGHSVLMRYEYWKGAVDIIQRNWLVGVGTGDIDQAFEQYYIDNDSKLDERWRLRAHNQYLTIFATFGVFGFIYFLLAFTLPFIRHRANTPFIFNVFLVITLFSMITEDTLESQAGVTLVAFFYCYFLFLPVKSQGDPS